MGNRDHVQRSNADQKGCHNCFYSDKLFDSWPCNVCMGNNDMYTRDPVKKAGPITGSDLGYKTTKKSRKESMPELLEYVCTWCEVGPCYMQTILLKYNMQQCPMNGEARWEAE